MSTLSYAPSQAPTPQALRPTADEWRVITADATSCSSLDVPHWIELLGRIGTGAPIASAAEFWVNWNLIGAIRQAGDVTKSFQLPPGQHVLACRSNLDVPLGRCQWMWRRTNSPSRTEEIRATTENTAVLTLGCYPQAAAYDALRVLACSAHQHNVRVNVLGIDSNYESHYVSKILRMSRWIASLPAEISYILYVDGADAFFCRPLTAICDAFCELGCSILVGSESTFWPCGDAAWKARFPHKNSGRRSLNAGMWMGKRSAINALLDLMMRLSDSLEGDGLTAPASIRPYRRFGREEQFLWQACYLAPHFLPDGLAVELDAEMRCFANATSGSWDPPPNREFLFERGLLTAKCNGAQPGVVHFPGRNRSHVMRAWAATFGIGADCSSQFSASV